MRDKSKSLMIDVSPHGCRTFIFICLGARGVVDRPRWPVGRVLPSTMSLPTTHASYGSAEFEDDPFSSDWSVTKTLRTSKALSAKIPSRATSSTDGQGTSSNPKSITYTISDFVDVRSTSPPLLDPPSGLSGSIPSSSTW